MPTNRCLQRFRPLSTRVLRALELRALNPTDTSWAAFNYYTRRSCLCSKYQLRAWLWLRSIVYSRETAAVITIVANTTTYNAYVTRLTCFDEKQGKATIQL